MNTSNKFNKKEYDINYKKLHKKQFKVDLNIEEYNYLEKLLTKYNLSKAQFLRNSIEQLKNIDNNNKN